MNGPTLTLNNDIEMPAIGLGVFQTPPDVTTARIDEALRIVYRLVDTAAACFAAYFAAHFDEREVGEGIRRSGLGRDEVFIQTKAWISDRGHDATLHAFDKAAANLGADRIDLPLLR